MKKLLTICAAVGLMLNTMALASLNDLDPNVNLPPFAPDWWNVECDYYAYAWWEDDISPSTSDVLPPDNALHWDSNSWEGTGWLDNTDFTASVSSTTVSVSLDNVYRDDYYKEIFIYLEGTTIVVEPVQPIEGTLDTGGGTLTEVTQRGGAAGQNFWWYVVEGTINPQPDYVTLTLPVPGLTSVTDI